MAAMDGCTHLKRLIQLLVLRHQLLEVAPQAVALCCLRPHRCPQTCDLQHLLLLLGGRAGGRGVAYKRGGLGSMV